jgi:hypothetical protein
VTTCPEQGLLRAYADREIDRSHRQAVEEHLLGCSSCQCALAQLETNAALVKGALDRALVSDRAIQPHPRQALDRCQEAMLTNDTFWDRIRKGGLRMKLSLRGTGPRLAAAVAALCLCMVVLLAFEPVRTAAEDFLGVFRAEKFTAVTIDINNPPEIPSPSELGTFTKPEPPAMHKVTQMQAANLVSFRILAPQEAAGLPGNPELTVTDNAQYSFTFNAEKVKAYLASKGISGMVLPKNLDGATVKVTVPPIVMKNYGDVANAVDQLQGEPRKQGETAGAATATARHLSLVETTSPTLETPPDFDVEMLRAQLLSSGLLPPELSSQLSSIQDWQSTAIIPVPSDANRRDVDVAGVPGMLVSGENYGVGVFWKRGDVIYGVAGNLSEEETLGVARSIK